ncbi:MAG: hypothetical protein KGS00_09820 [Alphaproteobacteria bacterium]|nr:hypothetical protein [Alphaproteobacteria bacterium]
MICKIYSLDDLADTREAIARRCAAIETFTSRFGPQTTFEIRGTDLIRHTERLTEAVGWSGFDRAGLNRLAEIVTHAHERGLVHGDIRPKNALWSGGQVWLCDWEPALRQIVNGRMRWMCTPPCRHPSDRRTLALTSLTDLMGLALFVPGIDLKQAAALASMALERSGPQAPRAMAGTLFPPGAGGSNERETHG